ncbi:MAG TPA: hypothetical protein VMQ44_01235 [Candidatus Saccharimonadales bacterium]|nr:hypothetical protein [Candidatus Saccharimonadales bacterium]
MNLNYNKLASLACHCATEIGLVINRQQPPDQMIDLPELIRELRELEVNEDNPGAIELSLIHSAQVLAGNFQTHNPSIGDLIWAHQHTLADLEALVAPGWIFNENVLQFALRFCLGLSAAALEGWVNGTGHVWAQHNYFAFSQTA